MSASDLVAQLAAAGTPPELLAAVAKELFAGEIERATLETRRKNERERKARSRPVTSRHVTERDDTGQPVTAADTPGTPALEVSPENPLPIPTPTPPYSPPAPQKRGTRLAEDFEPPEDWIAWAMKKRAWSRDEALDECECFIRYWQAKPGREACKLDWPKTWQNWAVNSRRSQGIRAQPVVPL